jgi:hypothetical protein
LTSLFYISDKLAGECPGKKLSRPRGFTLGGATVLFHIIYGTAEKLNNHFEDLLFIGSIL